MQRARAEGGGPYPSANSDAETMNPSLWHPHAFKHQILERPRTMLREVLERAVVRGEIPPERELELIPDLLISMHMLRIVSAKFATASSFRASSTRSSIAWSPPHPALTTATRGMRSIWAPTSVSP